MRKLKGFCVVLALVLVGSAMAAQAHGRGAEEAREQKMPDGDTGERVIGGVPKLTWGGSGTYTDDLMVVSALRVCLDHMGEEHSKVFLAGASGAAFDTGWADGGLQGGGGGAIFAHPHHFEAGLENLFKAVGRTWTVAYRTEPDRLWDVAVTSINAGRPVIASEWQIDHFAILAGYDATKKQFVGRRYAGRDEAPDQYVRIGPDELAFVVAIGGTTERTSPREAALGALRFAVASASTGRNTDAKGQGGTSHGMIYGPTAYAEHARLVPEQLDPTLASYGLREHFLFWRLDALQLARAYAVSYLQEIRDVLSPSEQKHVETALAAYCELLGMLRSDNAPVDQVGSYHISATDPHVGIIFGPASQGINPLFWCEGQEQRHIGDLLATTEGRRRFADWLLQMGSVEKRATDALARAVGAEALELSPRSEGMASMTEDASVKKLEGLQWRQHSISQLGCIEGCLKYLGSDMSSAWLFGGTGHAFVINIQEGLDPSGPTAWDWSALHDLGPNLGYRTERVFCWKDEAGDTYPEKQKQAWDFVRTAIDRGVPCYGWELHPWIPDYYVITGYDDTGYYYSGCVTGGFMEWQKLGDIDVEVLQVFSVERCEPAGAEKVLRDMLEHVLPRVEKPNGWTFHPGYVSGQPAFEYWAKQVEEGQVIKDGHSYNAWCWHECRAMAVEFLQEAKERLPGRCDAAFDEAIAHYTVVRDRLKAVVGLHPMRQEGWDNETKLRSPEAAALLRQAGKAEQRGIESLKKIAAAL